MLHEYITCDSKFGRVISYYWSALGIPSSSNLRIISIG